MSRSRETVFDVAMSTPYRWIGPTSDSIYSNNLDVSLSKMLYGRLSLRNSCISSMSSASPDPIRRENSMPADSHEVFSILDMSFAPDGKALVAGSADGNVYLLEPNTGKASGCIKQAHHGAVVSTCFINDYQFVSGSDASTIALWDLRKSSEAVNILQGHKSCIRELMYSGSGKEMLLSSSLDNTIRYWHLPSFQSRHDHQVSDNKENEHYRGVLANCPNLSQFVLSPTDQWLAAVNSAGNMYIVYNLDILQLSRTMKTMHFDDSLVMQLAWFNPNCSLMRKNRIRVLSGNDYAPPRQGAVSKVTGIQFHPLHCFLLMRVSVAQVMGFRTSEWSCGVNLRQLQSSLDNSWLTISSFGSEILEDTLMFSKEEEKSGLTDRKYSFSSCGRVFSSPGKTHVNLLAFSNNLDDPYSCMKKKASLGSIFDGGEACKSLVSIAKIQINEQVTCARFSSAGMLLAVGDKSGQVLFYQPSL